MKKKLISNSNFSCTICLLLCFLFIGCQSYLLEDASESISTEEIALNDEVVLSRSSGQGLNRPYEYPYRLGNKLYPGWSRYPYLIGPEFFNHQFSFNDFAYIVGPQDPFYNCIAWSVELYNIWLDLPIYLGIDEFVLFYQRGPHLLHNILQYFDAANRDDPDGVIDLFEDNNLRATHASRKSNNGKLPGYWESKCGKSYTVAHDRDGIAGPAYGYRFLSMVPRPNISISLTRTQIDEIKELVKKANPEISFTTEEVNMIKQEVAKFSSLKNEFDLLFERWKYEWNYGYMQFSNNTRDALTMQEFKDLVALGKSILPLVVEKMLDKSNFFAVRLYEELQDEVVPQEKRKALIKEKVASNELNLYQSVQNEAAQAVKEWLTRK